MIISDETKELALISSGKAKPVLGDRQSQHFAVREERLYSHFPRKQKWCILLHPVVHGDVQCSQEGFDGHIHEAIPCPEGALW